MEVVEGEGKRLEPFVVQVTQCVGVLPGVISGGLFAFVISFDEVVCVIFLAGFEQRIIPRQMWARIREQISPTILAVATLLIVFSVGLMFVLEMLRRRNERLRGIQTT